MVGPHRQARRQWWASESWRADGIGDQCNRGQWRMVAISGACVLPPTLASSILCAPAWSGPQSRQQKYPSKRRLPAGGLDNITSEHICKVRLRSWVLKSEPCTCRDVAIGNLIYLGSLVLKRHIEKYTLLYKRVALASHPRHRWTGPKGSETHSRSKPACLQLMRHQPARYQRAASENASHLFPGKGAYSAAWGGGVFCAATWQNCWRRPSTKIHTHDCARPRIPEHQVEKNTRKRKRLGICHQVPSSYDLAACDRLSLYILECHLPNICARCVGYVASGRHGYNSSSCQRCLSPASDVQRFQKRSSSASLDCLDLQAFSQSLNTDMWLISACPQAERP